MFVFRANCQLTKKLNFDDLTLPGPVPADLVHGCTAPVNLNESVTSSERTPSVTLPLNTTHSSGSLTRSPYSDSFHKARGVSVGLQSNLWPIMAVILQGFKYFQKSVTCCRAGANWIYLSYVVLHLPKTS